MRIDNTALTHKASARPAFSVSRLDFLKAILPEPLPHERIEVRAKTAAGHVIQEWFRRVEDAAAFEVDEEAKANVWFGVGLRNGEVGNAAGTTRTAALWADVDFKHFNGGEPPAMKALDQLPIPPPVIVASGHGLQPYWPIDVVEAQEREVEIRRALEGIRSTLSRFSDSPLDIVSDLPRILRLPGTTNWKNLDKPVPVRIIRFEVNA